MFPLTPHALGARRSAIPRKFVSLATSVAYYDLKKVSESASFETGEAEGRSRERVSDAMGLPEMVSKKGTYGAAADTLGQAAVVAN